MDLLTYAALKKKLSGLGGGSTIPSELENKVNKNTSDISSLKAVLNNRTIK